MKVQNSLLVVPEYKILLLYIMKWGFELELRLPKGLRFAVTHVKTIIFEVVETTYLQEHDVFGQKIP